MILNTLSNTLNSPKTKRIIVTVTFISVILIIIYLIIRKIYTCVGCEQRVYPFIRNNKEELFKQTMVAISDKIINDEIFIFKHPFSTGFKSIFTPEELKTVKKGAINFFKKGFGLSDLMIKTLMFEVRVNDNINYRIYWDQNTDKKNLKMKDGGFVIFLPAKTLLRGTYGGVNGVTVKQNSFLVYGYYLIENKYKIKYWSMCPLTVFKRYDGDYTFIDCDLMIEDAPDKKLIGLKGKGQGLQKTINLRNVTKQTTIRNIMTFF